MADRYDRLSALITRFDLRVLRVPLGQGNMAVFGDPETGAPGRVEIRTRDGVPAAGPNEAPVAACSIDWGGAANPLMAALPATVSLPIRDVETRALLDHLVEPRALGFHRDGLLWADHQKLHHTVIENHD